MAKVDKATNSCLDCYWYQATDETCHRYAPVGGANPEIRSLFPVVRVAWCGDWVDQP